MKDEMEHIDDFIGRKLEGKEFSYSEEYWLSAEKLIEETNTRKRMMILLFVVLLVFLLTTIFFFSNAFKSGEVNAEREYGNNSSSFKKETNTNEHIKTNAGNINRGNQYGEAEKNNSLRGGKDFGNDLKNQSRHTYIPSGDNTQKENSEIKRKNKITHRRLKASKTSPDIGGQDIKARESQLVRMETLKANLEIPSLLLLERENNYADVRNTLKPYKHFMGVHIGMLYNDGLKPIPVGGLYYIYQLRKNWELEARLNFKSPVLNNIERKSVTTKYNFGKQQEEVIVKSKQTYEVELPLLVKYQLYRKHYVSAGVAFNKIIGVQYEKISRTEGTQGNSESYERLMSADDVNPYYMQLKLGYDVFLIKPLRFEVGASYNLTDPVKSNSYLKGNTDKLQYQLSVSYNLFRWK